MKLKALTTATIAVLLLNVAIFAAPDNRKNKTKKVQTDRLVTLLPASDAAAVFDVKQVLETGLPRILAADQTMLAKIISHVDLVKERTGIDLRKFDRVAVGVTYKQVSATETDYEPVVLASATDLNFAALITAAKLATNGGHRSETIAGKQVSIFKVDPSKLSQKPVSGSKTGAVIDKIARTEFAAVAIDRTTLAVGTLTRVRETLEGRSRLGGDIASLIAAQNNGMLAFALKPPGGMAKLLPLQSDELGKVIDSIRFIAGSMQMDAAGGAVHLVGRTATAGEALSLRDTLEVGQSFGKMAFAAKKRPDQMVYNRLVNDARIDNKGNDVMVDVRIAQADIDTLIAGLKK